MYEPDGRLAGEVAWAAGVIAEAALSNSPDGRVSVSEVRRVVEKATAAGIESYLYLAANPELREAE